MFGPGGQTAVPQEGALWRGRLAHVSGWWKGTLAFNPHVDAP